MAITRTFQDMLNEFLPNELLKEELVKRDYVLSKVEKDNTWKGGTLIVPFKAAGASSIAFNALTDSTDIGEDKYVRGEISGHKNVWGSMIFNHRDLMEHDMVSEQNFLKVLPEAVDDFINQMKNVCSTNLLNGAHFATLTGDGAAGGTFVVDRPDRFSYNQKVYVDDDDSAISTAGYVSGIDMETNTITVTAARDGAGGAVNLSAYTVAQNAKCYYEGALTASFNSIRDALLSSANGGASTLYGVTKTLYPYLQAINVDGAAVTAANILEKVFDALTEIRQKGKGMPTEILMSYKNLGSAMKVIEGSKGAFNVVPNSQKAEPYGWMEIVVGSVTKGTIKLIGIQELDDDVIMFIDWRAIKFYSNGFFKKRVAPDGKEYFETRSTSGYQYIVDVCLFGDIVVQRPSYCGILHSISY